MSKSADCHTHTLHSDGTSAPAEVVRLAHEARLAAVAITDHDTVEGVSAAVAAGGAAGVRVVPGVELAAECDGAETHIVGLFIDPAAAPLAAALAAKRDERRGRFLAILDRLADLGVPLDPEAVLTDDIRDNPSRTHIAAALLEAGHVAGIQEAFDRYIGEGQPAYIPRSRFTVGEAAALIRAAGGVAVLAHPYTLTRDGLASMVSDGVMAVEAYNACFNPGWSRRLRQWARDLSIGVSGGSDYHGRNRVGVTIGAARLPWEFFEDLENRAHAGG